MKRTLLFCCLLAIYSCAVGAGGTWMPLNGEVKISSAPLSDPLPDGSPVAFFTIDGDAAKAIFDGMIKSRIVRNYCSESGMAMKMVGDISCTKQGRKYRCNFGVGLSDGKSQKGYTC